MQPACWAAHSLLGGSVGAIIGAVLGAWFLTQIDSVLVLLRIPAWWNDFIAGLVLLAVLVFDGRLRCALNVIYGGKICPLWRRHHPLNPLVR